MPARPRRPTPSAAWIGPAVVLATIALPWLAFAGTPGEDGDVSLGLYVGALAITAMSWSFLLAVRIRRAEWLFGGLDRMYVWHRWLGVLAVGAAFLHTETVDDLLNGIRGAGRDLAELGEELAEQGQTMLYVLIGISIVRLVPTRYWRWTHKLFVIPYGFACFHFVTADKPYSNISPWGLWFAAVMVVGLVAGVVRLIGKDIVRRGLPYRVTAIDQVGPTMTMRLAPVGGRSMSHRIGQFAFVKVQLPGLSEPHPFTIASHPSESQIQFFIRDLGDWTHRVAEQLRLDSVVVLEGPYGTFRPLPDEAKPIVWIAGGVGITPFIAAACSREPGDGPIPDLLYATRSDDDAPALAQLQAAHDAGRIRLHRFTSSTGNRLTTERLEEMFGANGLRGTHVALCGPASMVRSLSDTARRLGATHVEHEGFDLRSGIGPDRSVEIERLLDAARGSMPSHRTVG